MPATAPSSRPAPAQTRLASRVRVAGPHILIQLADRQMQVDGAGHLLIEDYRMRRDGRRARPKDAGASLLDGGPTAASLDSIGPSQTLFTWTESMSFLNSENSATFRNGVEMRHLSGSRMFEIDRLAGAMGIDPAQVRKLPGREAGLVCERFKVEFERDVKLKASDPSPLSRATRLKGFLASGRYVRLEESGRFVEGTEVGYDGGTQIGRVTGSAECPARLCERDPKTGRPHIQYVDSFVWDQRTGVIDVRNARGVGTGK
jgi:hypothetical protein